MARPLAPGIYEHPLTIGLDAQAAVSGDVGIEPLGITWALGYPLPADLFEHFAVLAQT